MTASSEQTGLGKPVCGMASVWMVSCSVQVRTIIPIVVSPIIAHMASWKMPENRGAWQGQPWSLPPQMKDLPPYSFYRRARECELGSRKSCAMTPTNQSRLRAKMARHCCRRLGGSTTSKRREPCLGCALRCATIKSVSSSLSRRACRPSTFTTAARAGVALMKV